MESSYAPPEVINQYAHQDDQKDDQTDDSQNSSSSANSQQPPFDPSQLSGTNASQSNNANPLAGQDFMGGGGEGGSTSTQTLNLEEQLKMLTPHGFLAAILGFEPTQEEQQERQKQAAKQKQLVFQSQQEWQAKQAQEQQARIALREEQETIKSQGRSFGQVQPDSVLFQRTTENPSKTDTQLLTRAATDAQKQLARQQQGNKVPKGKQQGPVDFATLSKQHQGAQKASEMTMGE